LRADEEQVQRQVLKWGQGRQDHGCQCSVLPQSEMEFPGRSG
jgi:hypothetical protein